MKAPVSISIIASALAALAVTVALLNAHTANEKQAPVIRASRVEIVDERGAVRISLEAVKNVATIRLRNENGDEAAVLTQDMTGRPVLYFNGGGQEAKVMLGYVCGSDVIGASGSIDCAGGWGLHIRGNDTKSTGVGFLDSGRPVVPLLSPGAKEPPRKARP